MACSVLIGFWSFFHPDRWWGLDPYASHLLKRAESAPESEAVRAVQRLAMLGGPGLRALVAAMQLPRKPVAQAASHAILAHLERWQIELNTSDTPDRSQIAREINLIAAQCAHAIEDCDPEARMIAARIARECLILAIRFPTADQGNLIGHCEAVLDAAGTPSRSGIDRTTGFTPAGIPREQSFDRAGRERFPWALSSPDRLAPLSESRFSLEQTTRMLPSMQEPTRPNRSHAMTIRDPDRLATRPPESTPDADTFQGEWRSWNRILSNRPAQQDPLSERQAIPTAADARMAAPMDRLDHISLREVMDLLHDGHRATAVAAARELRIRGFSTIEIALAKKMTDPDVSVRRQLIDEVQSIPDLEGRPWLFWLATDPDPGIRLAAMTVLATSTDPSSRRRLIELAARDHDPQIAGLAERLARISCELRRERR